MSQMSQSIKLFNSFKTSDLLRRWVLLKICSVDAFANNAYGVSNLRKFVIKYRAVTISQLKLDMADIVTGTSSSHSSTTNFLSTVCIQRKKKEYVCIGSILSFFPVTTDYQILQNLHGRIHVQENLQTTGV